MRYPRWRLLLFICAACLTCYWLYLGVTAALGPDPGKVLVDNLGQGALILLLCSLAMTPLQKLTGWAGWISFRRQLGLWAFAYGVLHLACYMYFLLGLDFSGFAAELADRPYIALGAIAMTGLLALAATSTRWSMRKLGKRWKKLHRLVYPTLIVALLHMLWVVRSDAGQWALFASIAAGLLFARLPAIQHCLVKYGSQVRNFVISKKTSNNR
ncbi:protein-methionine-sulfoxide reductase heme-binding subunit MsrQ [Stutzerimonas zhaodongensis]|uniref:Protein-methionine-sulfoxide reductase heme-binding subunit MsrQ n=1 Tax=Stutzerimonas zhaodongensis TaxID=1176257 RepID=A0A3M2HEA8_9GAMM|nr:protein-methionine-sulfoxide reductase heme-binding subunit MsrQ [Stutzerimonas zhaodongensis]MCQ4318605.1 protein-methionine-sulfoxide reductase heme-binding subunit MsrQ [Stutzerimonas zhaodongensis]RMH88076.1 protein-methionine-sulfoxide reductase heme-binding subunit MsrQ [Stutzerimonas zhaodongensis]